MLKAEFTKRLQEVSDRDAPRLHEHFTLPAERFDASSMGEYLLFPLEMTWFYDEPVYRQMRPEQRLMLNRLSFCQSYMSTAVAEAATNILNYEAAIRGMIRGDVDVALYMTNEVAEETVHIRAFYAVIRKVLAHYRLSLDDLRATNVSLPLATRYSQMHALIGWLRGDLDFYYFTRFALNVNQKTVERCTINEPNMHPQVREILKNHAIDEARHMQMSRGTGIRALAHMGSGWQRNLACIGYAHFAARIYIGRHSIDGRLQHRTRARTLELCGVPAAQAKEAAITWYRRKAQPLDPPLVRAGRRYYLKQNFAYIDELCVSERMKRYMKRVIGNAYADVVEVDASVDRLDFAELARAGDS
jgi:hypothetical protein